MKKLYNVFLFLLLCMPLFAQTPESVLKNIDDVQNNFDTLQFVMTMTIENNRRSLVKNVEGTTRNEDSVAFLEYTNPQDRGTRYLKLNEDMWIYVPDAQDVLKISGHLLRDGMMGSDISYNDMMDRGAYADDYVPSALVSTNIDGQNLWMLTITAKNDSVNYARQDLFVDKQTYLVRKAIMYAKGRKEDRAIKEFEMLDYKKISGLDFAMKLLVRDLRKKNSQTTVTYSDLVVNPDVNGRMFTRAYLEN